MLKEKLKNVGKRMIGKGSQVDFQKRYEKRMKEIGLSKEEAQKRVLTEEVFADVSDQIDTHGFLDGKTLQRLQGSLRHVFSPKELAQFKKDAASKSFRPLSGLPGSSAKERNLLRDYFRKKYDGQAPSRTVAGDMAESQIALKALLDRVRKDPSVKSGKDIMMIINSTPELRADLGKIMALGSNLDRHETKFKKKVNFDHSINELKQASRNALSNKVWGDHVSWTGIMKDSIKNPRFSSYFKIMGATGSLLLKSSWGISRTLYRLVRSAGALARRAF